MKENQPYSDEYANDTASREYFSNLALHYLSLIKLHRESGHLPSFKNLSPEQKAVIIKSGGQKDWTNVVRHCLAEAGAADAFAHLLGLSEADKDTLIRAAILHDFNKKVEVEALRASKENQMSVVEKTKLMSREVLLKHGVKPEIVEIINEVGDLDIVHKENVNLLQKILFYIDNITEGSNLVSIKEKHAGLVKRYPKLAAEGAYDKWVSSTEEVQRELAEKIGLDNPDELPNFILQKVKQLAEEKSAKNTKKSKKSGEAIQNEGEVWEKFSPDVKLMSETVLSVGEEAARLQNTFTEKDLVVKSEDSVGSIQAYVTPADVECQQLIFDSLSKAHPETRFLMEEKIEKNDTILDEKNYPDILKGLGFMVDPIDGTSQYMKNLDQWAVVIAKIQDGEIVAGSIYAPKFGLLVTGEKNVGVMIKDQHPNERFADVLVGQGMFEFPEFNAFIENLNKSAKKIEKARSGELGLAMVAAGKVDVCIQAHEKVWDFAAGAALVEAAGGQVIYYNYRDNKIVRMDKLDAKTFNPKERQTAIIASLGNQAEEYFAQIQSLWEAQK